MSCDFNLFYTTINEHSRKISQKSFIDLFKAGRQYRAEAPAMYCPKCQTAISQVECEDMELPSFFNDIVFKVNDDGKEKDLIIATTRPELLPACVSIFYHPSDERYKHLNGKKARVPIFEHEVPILEDERADPEKGTGIVMCCTFGDATDAEWQKAHNLPIREAFGRNGKMTDLAGKYEGLSIVNARKEIISDMKENGLLVSQKPIQHAVNVHERCGTPIEFIHSKQWFVKLFGTGRDRESNETLVIDEVIGSDSHRVLSYPTNKRPRSVKEGDLMFIGRMVKDPDDIMIYGRVRGLKHDPRIDNATPEDIKLRKWKKEWSRYIRVYQTEFANGTLGDCVSLYKLMNALGPDIFMTTQFNARRGKGNINPKHAYRSQASVRLTEKAAQLLNNQLDKVLSKLGRLSEEELNKIN
jgi:valyl-tRNA synthetase